ncbi:MAG: alpha-ketoacid dehydrogenase subunit beta [Chloroflexi bacterium]|nr:alpha-ketoacid dehydrogenase subunit beta [Chloroflexota bacterium]
MAELTLREALNRALKEALERDPGVFLMGEDIGAYGGAYAVTRGLWKQYGPERVRDTPISEAVIVGAGIGAALAGMRPIVELMTINFSLLAADQIVNTAAKLHYMSGGQLEVPLLIRTVTGGGGQLGATHSQSFEGWYATVPGLRVVAPATPYDALGLFRACLKDRNTVIFAEHALLYGVRGQVPDEYYEVPLGLAEVKRQGSHLTIVAYSRMVHIALAAAEQLARRGVESEVIDLRTLRPLDTEAVVNSVRKTHRAVIVEEGWQSGGIGPLLALLIQEQAFDHLDGPVVRVAGADAPAPYNGRLERSGIPNEDAVVKAVESRFGL